MNTFRATKGYKTYTGYLMTQADADAYNRFTDEIERERWPATKEFLKDQRHRLFVAMCQEAAA